MGLVSLRGVLFVATPFVIPARFGLPLAISRPLGLGVVVSLAKGFDYEEATILLLVLLALLPCRKHYFRHARLVTLSFSVSWILAVVMSFGLLFWLILFAYQLERSEQTGTVRRSDALPAGRPAQRHGVFVYPANAVGP